MSAQKSSDHDEAKSKDIADSSELSELFKKIDKLQLRKSSHQKLMKDIASDAVDVTMALLYKNNIGDNGAVALAEGLRRNVSLQELNLWNNNIGDTGTIALAEALRKNVSLQQLSLFYNNIGDNGAVALAEGLRRNVSLQELNLGSNKIGDDGAAALGESLRENATLQKLDLAWNNLTRASLLVLAKVFRTNKNMEKLSAQMKGAHLDSVDVTKEIGHGEFGTVWLGTTRAGHAEVVQKSSHGTSNREEVYEVLILQGLPEHQNVIKIATILFGGKTDLVLEAHKGGDLREYARIHEDGTIQPFFIYSHGMSLAIEHLHMYGLLHRDVALRNYVLTEDLLRVVLVDFGLSWPVGEEKSVTIRPDETMPFRQCAPEVLSTLQYSKGADIWQLGLAFWQLLQRGRQPFSVFANGQQLVKYLNKKMIQDNAPIPVTFRKNGAAPDLIAVVKEIVVFCCPFDPAERPTATQVVQKIEYLRSYDGIAAAEEEEGKEMPKFVRDKSIVDAGLEAYNYTDYERLKTGGISDYIDLKKDLEEHQYDELEEFPDIDLEEEVIDEEDQYQKLETETK